MHRRDHALISRQDFSVIRDLEDQIERMKANIDYVQESIAESQANIMQIEESKVWAGFLFPFTLTLESCYSCLIIFVRKWLGYSHSEPVHLAWPSHNTK